jgi:hypothetical protein
MTISKFQALFNPRAPIVDPNSGIPHGVTGSPLLNALVQRTGGGTGIANKVTPSTAPLAATGLTMDDALPLTQDWNHVGTVPPGSGVQIAPALTLQPGNDIWVFNNGANNLNVHPPDNNTKIDGLAPGTAFSLAPGKTRCFQLWTPTQFNSYGN